MITIHDDKLFAELKKDLSWDTLSDAIKAIFLSWLEENDHIITERDIKRMYEDMLDEYPVVIGSLEYSGSHVLQNIDPIAYRCGLSDYMDSMGLNQLCDYGMDSDDYVEDIDSLWYIFEDEMLYPTATT